MNPTGLTSTEASTRLKTFGPNTLFHVEKLSGFRDFISRFKNPLLIILIVAALVSGFLGDVVTASIIIVIVLASVTIDFINTHKSNKVAAELTKQVMITASVMRDGHELEIPLQSIVPDDIVIVRPGDLIPADGMIVSAKDFFVNESSLSGESFPQEKQVDTMVYTGTSVITGESTLKITQTGSQTKFSHIAATLLRADTPTDFDRGISEFSSLIMKLTFVLVLGIFLINAFLKHGFLESLLFASALAVGLTPELLPMIIALNLSKGSIAMSKKGVIVKKLSSIQNFGSMDILCTDKTGTLTEDLITLIKHVDGLGNESDDVFTASYLASIFSSNYKSPLDEAITTFKKIDTSNYTKIDEIPFDYERKRDSVIVEHVGKKILITKGAPEQIFAVSKYYDPNHEPLTADLLKKITAEYESLSQDGFRVIAVANKEITEEKSVYDKSIEENLTFLGFITFLDPAKKSVTETLQALETAGIEIKIVTGDNELVTQKICRDIHLTITGILHGDEIESMSDDELKNKVEAVNIFARVNPEQKERVIKILRSLGHVVGYMGDGINDAPPLKAADVGISVNNAVDVAKDTADIILLQKSLASLMQGVLEGRKTFTNTLKYILMNLSSNFGNMFSMAGATIFLPFLPMTAPQILLNNLLYDGSQLTIPSDSVDSQYLNRPQKFSIGFLRNYMLIFGPLSSVFDFATFAALIFIFHLTGNAFQTGWFLESIITQTFVVYIIRTRKIPFLQSSPSVALGLSTILSVVIGWAIVYSPLGKLFKFTALGIKPILVILIISAVYLVTTQFVKNIFYRFMMKKALASS